MKLTKLAFVALASAAMIYAGCKSHKHNTTSTAAATPPPATETAPPPPPTPPGNGATVTDPFVQLALIAQSRWPDVTAKTMSDGRELYYNGACVNCHGAKKIARFSEEEWPSIMDRMAPKAQITDAQKDAVLKYVIAVKMSGM